MMDWVLMDRISCGRADHNSADDQSADAIKDDMTVKLTGTSSSANTTARFDAKDSRKLFPSLSSTYANVNAIIIGTVLTCLTFAVPWNLAW